MGGLASGRLPAAATPRAAGTTGTAEALRRRRQQVILLVHVARHADHQKLERSRAAVLERSSLAYADRNGVTGRDRCGLTRHRRGAFSAHHIVKAADARLRP